MKYIYFGLIGAVCGFWRLSPHVEDEETGPDFTTVSPSLEDAELQLASDFYNKMANIAMNQYANCDAQIADLLALCADDISICEYDEDEYQPECSGKDTFEKEMKDLCGQFKEAQVHVALNPNEHDYLSLELEWIFSKGEDCQVTENESINMLYNDYGLVKKLDIYPNGESVTGDCDSREDYESDSKPDSKPQYDSAPGHGKDITTDHDAFYDLLVDMASGVVVEYGDCQSKIDEFGALLCDKFTFIKSTASAESYEVVKKYNKDKYLQKLLEACNNPQLEDMTYMLRDYKQDYDKSRVSLTCDWQFTMKKSGCMVKDTESHHISLNDNGLISKFEAVEVAYDEDCPSSKPMPNQYGAGESDEYGAGMLRKSGVPPIANSDSVSTQVNEPVIIDVLKNDIDPDQPGVPGQEALDIIEYKSGDMGTVERYGNKLKYIPNEDECGNDKFMYTIADKDGLTDSANVHIDIECPTKYERKPESDPYRYSDEPEPIYRDYVDEKPVLNKYQVDYKIDDEPKYGGYQHDYNQYKKIEPEPVHGEYRADYREQMNIEPKPEISTLRMDTGMDDMTTTDYENFKCNVDVTDPLYDGYMKVTDTMELENIEEHLEELAKKIRKCTMNPAEVIQLGAAYYKDISDDRIRYRLFIELIGEQPEPVKYEGDVSAVGPSIAASYIEYDIAMKSDGYKGNDEWSEAPPARYGDNEEWTDKYPKPDVPSAGYGDNEWTDKNPESGSSLYKMVKDYEADNDKQDGVNRLIDNENEQKKEKENKLKSFYDAAFGCRLKKNAGDTKLVDNFMGYLSDDCKVCTKSGDGDETCFNKDKMRNIMGNRNLDDNVSIDYDVDIISNDGSMIKSKCVSRKTKSNGCIEIKEEYDSCLFDNDGKIKEFKTERSDTRMDCTSTSSSDYKV